DGRWRVRRNRDWERMWRRRDGHRERFASSPIGICCCDVATECSCRSRGARECPCHATETYAWDRDGCAPTTRRYSLVRCNLVRERDSHLSSRRLRAGNLWSRRCECITRRCQQHDRRQCNPEITGGVEKCFKNRRGCL